MDGICSDAGKIILFILLSLMIGFCNNYKNKIDTKTDVKLNPYLVFSYQKTCLH